MGYLKNVFSYNNMGTWTRIKEKKIFLPTNQHGSIDSTYMEDYVNNVQKHQYTRIKDYLETNRLDDCTLSPKERDCIQMKNVTFKAISIGSLFDIHPTKAYKATNKDLFKEKGKIPVVANSSVDNGIGGWTNLDATEKGNKVVFSDTTTSDSIFYQPNDFVGYPHVQGLYPYCNKWSENSLLYFISCFRKSASGLFNYGNKFTRVIASKMNVNLPITKNGDIDYDFMENFVSAQKKLIAKKLICWLEQQNINDNILKIEKNIPDYTLPEVADKNIYREYIKRKH